MANVSALQENSTARYPFGIATSEPWLSSAGGYMRSGATDAPLPMMLVNSWGMSILKTQLAWFSGSFREDLKLRRSTEKRNFRAGSSGSRLLRTLGPGVAARSAAASGAGAGSAGSAGRAASPGAESALARASTASSLSAAAPRLFRSS